MNCIQKKSYTRAINNPQSAMRNFSSCFSNHSIKLTTTAAAAPAGNTPTITSIFRARLSSGQPLTIKLIWYMNQADPSLSITVDDNPDFNNPWKATSMNSQLLKKKKGSLSFLTSSSSGSLHWDFSAARYQQGRPEPTENFYFAVIIDDEIALLLGDKSENLNLPIAEFSLLCRREEVFGRSLNSITRAKFGEAGKDHEISIRCRETELLVSIDKKRVVHVVKLNWNFRGNETIFVDGLPVDMMWDMHGWWFGSLAGHAVFLFRQRGKLETRLWLEEKGSLGFSLLIQAFRSTF